MLIRYGDNYFSEMYMQTIGVERMGVDFKIKTISVDDKKIK